LFLISGTIKSDAANESFAGSRGDKAVSFEEWVFVLAFHVLIYDGAFFFLNILFIVWFFDLEVIRGCDD
jgi:hypothetical protein